MKEKKEKLTNGAQMMPDVSFGPIFVIAPLNYCHPHRTVHCSVMVVDTGCGGCLVVVVIMWWSLCCGHLLWWAVIFVVAVGSVATVCMYTLVKE